MMESNHDLSFDDPSKTFLGVCFTLHGFDSVKEDKVRSKLLEGGGIDAVNYGPNCNHVIVDKLVYDDPICIAARRDGKVLVTGLWVDHSFDVGMSVDPTSVMYWPMKDLNGIPGAKSLVMCLTGYQKQDRDDIMTMVSLMGANFSKPLVANKITHLICYKFEGEKYELAKKMKKIKLINHRWLEDCLKAWELLPETDYAKSGYELVMEAEAKDSEEETEDNASIDLRKRIVVSPQNARAESKILHQSPLRQEVSRNTVYLSASENFANAGDTSKTKSIPAKEVDCAKTPLSRGTHDKHLDKSTSSCARSPVKTSSKASNILDGITMSEKVEHVTASASRSAKKSPNADLSKLSSKSRKSSLPLRSERTGNHGSPVASNASKPGFIDSFDMLLERHQNGTDSHGAKTPLKESSLNLDEGHSKSLSSKRKATASRGSSKSRLLSYSPKTMKLPVFGSSIDGSDRLVSDVSPAKVTSHSRQEVSCGVDMLSQKLLDRIVSDGVKTPSKANLFHLDEGQTGNLSSKRKTMVSRGSSRSPISSHKLKTSSESGVATKMTELPISGSSIAGSHRLAGNISPMNITSRLREEALLPSREALNVTTSEDRQDCNDQELQHSPQGFEKQTLSNLDADNPFCRTSGVEMHQSDPPSIEPLIPRTSSRVDEMDDQGDLNFSKVENKGNQSKPKKTKMLAKKTLGSRPKIPKGSTAKRKGLVNLQSAALQNECTNLSNGAVAMEVIDDAAIPEKVEDGPVDDESKAPDDKEQDEFGLGSDAENSTKVGASSLVKNGSRTKKQANCKTVQRKEKSAKSLGVKKSGEAEKSSRGKKNELPESKSTEDAGEGEITKGKEQDEFDLGSDIEHSTKVGASSLGKNKSCTKKQVNCKTVQMKEKSAKSVGDKNKSEAEKSSRGKKNKLPESKSTGDAGEGEVTKGKEQDEFDLGSDVEHSTKVGASSLGKNGSCTKKQVNCKTVQMKEKSAKSVGDKKKGEAEKSSRGKKSELPESKSTGDAGEGEITKGKEQDEFDLGSDVELSLGKIGSCTKRQVNCKTVQIKEKSAKSVGVEKNGEAEKSSRGKKNELPESRSTGDAGEGEITKSKKRPLTKSKTNKSKDSREEVQNDGSRSKQEKETNVLSKKRPSKKLKSSADEDKENEHATDRQQSASNDIEKVISPLKNNLKVNEMNSENFKANTEPAMFILSGHRLQRKEFQQVIKRLKGRVCRDSHNWSYQATHFIVPDPVKRTEKFFAAAASGCWILKTDYLTASNEAGRFLSEEAYEWHKKCLTEDGAINLQAPRKWRLSRERTGRGAFYGMRIIIYGECIAPPLDTLKRAVKAGDGTILATSPPYTRFLNSGVDFAIVSPVMPQQDIWIQEFLRHEVPCVVADYLVEYVCKPGYSLQKHVQYNTHAWAQKSLDNLVNRLEEAVVDPTTPEDHCNDDVACRVCESRDRGDEMLICGDESGCRGCGVGIHIDCLDPPLASVPEEDWFCSECSQKREAKARKRGSKSRK